MALINPRSHRKAERREHAPSFADSYREVLAKEEEEEEEEDEVSERSDASDSGYLQSHSFAAALRAAQTEGKPLLVVVVSSTSSTDAVWAAVTHRKLVSLLRRGGQVVLWGARAGTPELQQVARKVKGVDWGVPGVVALLRPARQAAVGEPAVASSSLSSTPIVLGSFPPALASKSSKKAKKSLVTATRLLAWVSSTLDRYKPELAADAKVASDRAIVAEVHEGLKSGLAADLERERGEAKALAAAKQARAEAARVKAEEAAAVKKEKARCAELRESLGPEPAAPATKGKASSSSASASAPSSSSPAAAVATVAVRLPDGSRQRRRFLANEHTAGSVLDWLDCEFGLASDSLRLREATGGGSIAAPSASSSAQFECAGRIDPVAKRSLASLGFLGRPVLLTAEVVGI